MNDKPKKKRQPSLRSLEKIMDQGFADVRCKACGETRRVEPDADYLCSCGRGRLTSPLLKYGFI